MADETQDKQMQDSETPQSLSIRDVETLIAAVRNLKSGQLEIDYANLASEMGAKTPASASTSWANVKKKLYAKTAPMAPNSGGSSPAKPRTPRKPKDGTGPKTPKSAKTDAQPSVKGENEGSLNSEDAADVCANDQDGDVKQEIKVDPKEGLESTIESTPKAEVSTPKKPKSTKKPKTPVTPKAESDDGEDEGPETPVTPDASTPRKRGRKTKAEKEAELAANGSANEGEDEEKPAKKPRKTPTKKPKDAASTPRKPKAGKKANQKQGDDDVEGEQNAKVLAELAKQAAEVAEANDVINGKKKIEVSVSKNASDIARPSIEGNDHMEVDSTKHTQATTNGKSTLETDHEDEEVKKDIKDLVEKVITPDSIDEEIKDLMQKKVREESPLLA